MKAILIGGAVAVVAVVGGWVAFSGARGPGTSVAAQKFDYETATVEDRKNWLVRHAAPTAARFDKTLPRGDKGAPDMKVAGWRVDALRRQIDIAVAVKGDFQIDRASVPAARKAMTAQVCPGYASSALGENAVTLVHSFRSGDGREALSVSISPLVCRDYL